MNFGLSAKGCGDLVAEKPAACDEGAAAAEQNDRHDYDDHRGVVLFGLFRRGDRHFRHDFSPYDE